MPAVRLPTSYKSNDAVFMNMPNMPNMPNIFVPRRVPHPLHGSAQVLPVPRGPALAPRSSWKPGLQRSHKPQLPLSTNFGPKYSEGALNKRSRSQVRTKACLLRIQFASTNRQKCCCNMLQLAEVHFRNVVLKYKDQFQLVH